VDSPGPFTYDVRVGTLDYFKPLDWTISPTYCTFTYTLTTSTGTAYDTTIFSETSSEIGV
jgi:hypothetical protein